MKILSQRGENLLPSPTLALNQKAKELKKQGKDVISFSAGEPEWEVPDFIIHKAGEFLKKGANRYTPSSGIEELKKAVLEKLKRDFHFDYEISDVSISHGAKFALFACLEVLVEEDDEVLIPAPYWVSYPEMVKLTGAKSVFIPSFETSNFKLDAKELKKYITPKSKVLILNSPVNPTGQVYTKKELEDISEILEKNPQIFILCDDVYSDLSFSKPTHLLEASPKLKDRTVIISSVSKSYSMTGWRIGWSVSSCKDIIQAVNKYQSQSISCTNHVAQLASITALREGDLFLKESREKLKDKKNMFIKLASELGFETLPVEATFYCLLSIKDYLGGRFKTSRDFSQALLEEQKVAAMPSIDFGLEGYLRLSYCLSFGELKEGLQRLHVFTKSLGSSS